MSAAAPLRAVFFDIGGTLGIVSGAPHARRLEPFETSAALLTTMAKALGLLVGVISNIPTDMSTDEVRAMLAAAGLLPLLDGNAIVTSRDAGADKPAPQIYQFAATQVGLPIGQCLYVGEDPGEVAGAQAAGMAGILKPAA
jgi:FMN phosphatase YigB (HAD superfamily)